MVFRFSLGGYFNDHNYTVRLEDDFLFISDNRYSYLSEKEKRIAVTDNENWARLLSFVKQCRWQKTYESDILDGTQWELKVKGSGCNLKSYGSNAYPEDFGEFVEMLNNLIKPTEIKVTYNAIS